MSDTASQPAQPYDPSAIFHDNGPIEPIFIGESVRALMRAMPLANPAEPRGLAYRRMYTAMRALAALHPRDEIEVMLGVQAVSAYHAATACWYIGMNLRQPSGDSTRHITTAASAARTFDTLLKALERRQAKSLTVPPGRPAAHEWSKPDVPAFMARIEARCRDEEYQTPGPPGPGHRAHDDQAGPAGLAGHDDQAGLPGSSHCGHDHPAGHVGPASHDRRDDQIAWTSDDLAVADAIAECERIKDENQGLDLAATEGILPGGGMIMPQNPTQAQAAYIARRLGLSYKREYAENLRQGIRKYPRIRPLRTGDLIT
jgi:hypothetical protein